MLCRSAAALVALFGAALTSFAAPTPADSRISAVAVYTDRAVVTRQAHVTPNASGLLELAFENLPSTLLDDSLQVTGRGTAETSILDVTARPVFVAFTPNERVKTLEDELRGLASQDRTFADRMNVLNQQRDYVTKIQNATTTPAKEGSSTPSGAENWIKLLTFTEDQLGKISAELHSIENQRDDLAANRSALEQQLKQIRGAPGRSYKTVSVRLDAAAAGAVDLTLRYTVPNASWTPSYDARLLSNERLVQLSYFGSVRQSTGEDWKDVELTLSTARPALGGAAPELQAWVVQERAIQPMAAPMTFEGRMKKVQGRSEDAVMSPFNGGALATLADQPSIESRYIGAQLDTQATSASFKIVVPVSLPSDNAPQRIPVTSVRLAATSEYTATPKLLPAAFLNSKVSNASEFPLLAGAMNVFLDDTFVASSHLRTVMPGEDFDLALGADEGITVKRRLNRRFTEDTGLMSKGKRITYDFTLSVQNNKRTAEKIVLLDQVPVSRHEKISVKISTPDEKAVKPDAVGKLKWTLDLAPGETRELPLKFTVEYPSDFPVAGLE